MKISTFALLEDRSIPSANDTKSTAKKLFDGQLRNNLPDLRQLVATDLKKKDNFPSRYLPLQMGKKNQKNSRLRLQVITKRSPLVQKVCVGENNSMVL